jgi:hypothetical protein
MRKGKDPDPYLGLRMRISEAQKHTDPTDPDPDAGPEHWKKVLRMRIYNRHVELDHDPCFLLNQEVRPSISHQMQIC